MRYVARVYRGPYLPEVQYRGELGYVRAKATRKLRQRVAKNMGKLQRQAENGMADPLAVVLMADHVTIGQDNWGGTIRYKDRLIPDEAWRGSYAVFVD